MRKILTTLVASAVIGATALSMSSPANAGWGWPFFWGGVAAGAIVGGALAAPYYYIGRTPTTGRATLTGQAITRQAMGADPCGTVTPGYAAASESAACRIARRHRRPHGGTPLFALR